MDDALPVSLRPPKPRWIVEPEKLKEEIAPNVKLVRGRNALKDQAIGEAFLIVASLIVDDMVRRGYEVTAPPPNEMHSWPPRPSSPYPLKD